MLHVSFKDAGRAGAACLDRVLGISMLWVTTYVAAELTNNQNLKPTVSPPLTMRPINTLLKAYFT